MALDRQERIILEALQKDATLPVSDIAQQAGLSTPSCWRRIRQLRDAGYIRRQVALLDPGKVNLLVTVITSVTLRDKSVAGQREFEQFSQLRNEVQECLLLSGGRDYQLKVIVPTIKSYEHFLTSVLLNMPIVESAESNFVLREAKQTTALPLGLVE
ncbi:Lrp/AsnC family transcriptional regulator [Geopsychrobacter electrodiphilus]|uniref:Lrp/AsnC family transcriptional regulator n=1 Tax=Geopsychrobacter electrodiphilus TaxID=225196 RepID=UPI000379A21A|nr:Lrp/AsnC family transcriptional regulator [Geopsychrobacter electrodiphilus]